MEDGFKPIECNDGDVLDFGDNTYKVAKFKQAMDTSSNSRLKDTLNQELNQELSRQRVRIKQPPNVNWFHNGMECEILTVGSQSWKKGKVKIKISVEFYLEEDVEITNNENSEIVEPESPLDDLRRMIHE